MITHFLIALQISPNFEVVGNAIDEAVVALSTCLIGHKERVPRSSRNTRKEHRGASFHSSVARGRALGQESMNEMNRHRALADR